MFYVILSIIFGYREFGINAIDELSGMSDTILRFDYVHNNVERDPKV